MGFLEHRFFGGRLFRIGEQIALGLGGCCGGLPGGGDFVLDRPAHNLGLDRQWLRGGGRFGFGGIGGRCQFGGDGGFRIFCRFRFGLVLDVPGNVRLLGRIAATSFQRHFQVGLLFFQAGLFQLHRDQPLPVSNGDLIVVGVDFREGEEPVPVAAVFNESRLEAGLHTDDFGEVDIPFELPLGGGLDVEIF